MNAYLRNSGYHEAAWRVSATSPGRVLDPRHYLDPARTAERGVLDAIFLPDSPGVAEFRSEWLPGAGFDPLQVLSAVATATERVGLIATVSTTYSYPLGHPLLTQAGSSPAGVTLAARYADAVFTPLPGIEAGQKFRRNLRDQARAAGRDPDGMRVMPGLSFLLAGSDAEAAALRDELEAAASSEFRWRNLANLAGLDYTAIDPDAPFPPGLLAGAPTTSFGASIYQMAADDPAATFRAVAQKLSALPGGLDFTGTPEGLADLITAWWDAGACDGFTLMPNVLPDQLTAFVDHVVPILHKRGLARTEYAGTTLRDHFGLPRPPGRGGR